VKAVAAQLFRLARGLQALNVWVAQLVAWLLVALVLVFITVVVLRYGFGIGSILLQEVAIYLHATAFMLAAAGTLALDGHVRVDAFSTRFSPALRRGVELSGHLLLLLPFATFLLWASWGYVAESWRLREGSADAGGLPFVYLLKTVIPLLSLQLILQALASALLLFQRGPDTGHEVEPVL
jgi:TRAP-type mannitol/chloroaromatic compound transport system permease small subunit